VYGLPKSCRSEELSKKMGKTGKMGMEPRARAKRLWRRVQKQVRRFAVVPLRRFAHRGVPIAMVTGSCGKTTTTRMLAHILAQAGHTVGFCSTEGVVIGGEVIDPGDRANYFGAATVLQHPAVTAAVLEVARGGLLSHGRYLDRCDVAALLNIENEQVGIDGIDSLDAMARHKQQVIDAARKAVVLNADDWRCAAMADEYPRARVTLFSRHPDQPTCADHLRRGGALVTLAGSEARAAIVFRRDAASERILAVADLPSALGGAVQHNVANAMAAIALARGMGIDTAAIAGALATFANTFEQSCGRFNLVPGYPFAVLLDYGSSPPAVRSTVAAIDRLEVAGRRLCMISAVGNRPDSAYDEIAEAVAGHFDHYVCYDDAAYRRQREVGEIAHRIRDGLLARGIPDDLIDVAFEIQPGLAQLAEIAQPGDLLAVLGADARTALPLVRDVFARYEGVAPTRAAG
jgi:cyanophycin synthetase